MSELVKIVRLDTLTPASYNPRKLSDAAQEELKKSLTDLGIIKAIVVRSDNRTILAGHQRTKTMALLGINECPAFLIPKVSVYDEVRFNQLHNYTEVEVTEDAPEIYISVPEGYTGFITVNHKAITMLNPGGEGGKVKYLAKLLSKYGQFANVVCDYMGKVIVSALYAKAIKLLRKDLVVYVLPKGKEEQCLYYFSKKYGEFNYDHIKRNTYIQHKAQPDRPVLYHEDGKFGSVLYDKVVIPTLKKPMRILDFGAGLKEYHKKLKGERYDIDAIEFFFVGSIYKDVILTDVTEKDCDEICKHLKEKGLYDVVVCDSVINSVDSKEAEKSVLLTLSALCKKGGMIYWSGRGLEKIQKLANTKFSKWDKDRAFFLDADQFTGNYVNGVWYFQHYHNMEMVRNIQERYIGKTYEVYDDAHHRDKYIDEITSSSFQVAAVNERPASKEALLEAVRFEFSLPLPQGKHYELDKKILPILENLL